MGSNDDILLALHPIEAYTNENNFNDSYLHLYFS